MRVAGVVLPVHLAGLPAGKGRRYPAAREGCCQHRDARCRSDTGECIGGPTIAPVAEPRPEIGLAGIAKTYARLVTSTGIGPNGTIWRCASVVRAPSTSRQGATQGGVIAAPSLGGVRLPAPNIPDPRTLLTA